MGVRAPFFCGVLAADAVLLLGDCEPVRDAEPDCDCTRCLAGSDFERGSFAFATAVGVSNDKTGKSTQHTRETSMTSLDYCPRLFVVVVSVAGVGVGLGLVVFVGLGFGVASF